MAIVIKWSNDEISGEFELNKDQACSVGRVPENTISLDDTLCSSKHIEIKLSKNGSVKISDMNSKNGTYLNGVRVDSGNFYLGDDLKVGSTHLSILASELTEEEVKKVSFSGSDKNRSKEVTSLDIDTIPYESRGARRTKSLTEQNISPIRTEEPEPKYSKRSLYIFTLLAIIALAIGSYFLLGQYRLIS